MITTGVEIANKAGSNEAEVSLSGQNKSPSTQAWQPNEDSFFPGQRFLLKRIPGVFPPRCSALERIPFNNQGEERIFQTGNYQRYHSIGMIGFLGTYPNVYIALTVPVWLQMVPHRLTWFTTLDTVAMEAPAALATSVIVIFFLCIHPSPLFLLHSCERHRKSPGKRQKRTLHPQQPILPL